MSALCLRTGTSVYASPLGKTSSIMPFPLGSSHGIGSRTIYILLNKERLLQYPFHKKGRHPASLKLNHVDLCSNGQLWNDLFFAANNAGQYNRIAYNSRTKRFLRNRFDQIIGHQQR